MLKFYSVSYTTYHNGTFIAAEHGRTICDESEIKAFSEEITWDNLTEILQKYGCSLPFNVWKFKKGRRVSFFSGNPFKKDFRDIKEWKSPLNLTIKVQYKDISNVMSIQDVLNWHDAEKAIQYLNERGLKIK